MRIPSTTRSGVEWPFRVTKDFTGLDPESVALTIDDGPTEHTITLLHWLERLGIPATFFVVGERVEQCPHVIDAIIRRGHSLGLHGWSHTRFTEVARNDLRSDLERTQAALPVPVTLVRPPYGDLDEATLNDLVTEGFKVVGWSVHSEDWHLELSREALGAELADDIVPGDIVLMHDLPGAHRLLLSLINGASTKSLSWTHLRSD